MQITVIGGDDVGVLTSLLAHLRAERELRGLVRPRYRPAGPEDLGGVLDAVTVAVGSGGLGVVLAQSLSGWISSRRSGMKIKITAQDGTTMDLETTDAATAERIIVEFLRHNA